MNKIYKNKTTQTIARYGFVGMSVFIVLISLVNLTSSVFTLRYLLIVLSMYLPIICLYAFVLFFSKLYVSNELITVTKFLQKDSVKIDDISEIKKEKDFYGIVPVISIYNKEKRKVVENIAPFFDPK